MLSASWSFWARFLEMAFYDGIIFDILPLRFSVVSVNLEDEVCDIVGIWDDES